MSRMLIRAGKEPWIPVTPETSLTANVIGTNTGNAVFSSAVFSALSTPGASLEADYFRIERGQVASDIADVLNEQYDHIVLPFANAFRRTFLPFLNRWTDVIARLRIPVTITGIGGQFSSDAGVIDVDDRVRDATKRFARAVLDRSPSIGVRGGRTADLLEQLGFGSEHIRTIGCPSMYRADRPVDVHKRTPQLGADARLGLAITPRMNERGNASENMARVIETARERFGDVVYIPQDGKDLAQFLWGIDPGGPKYDGFPTGKGHWLFDENRSRIFVDPYPWFDELATADFAVGSRIHGAIAALVAGTPAFVLAFDSRTRELSEYHGIPHRILQDFDGPVDFDALYDEFDEGAFAANQAENLARYRDFLDEHALAHTFDDPGAQDEYRDKIASAKLPGGVESSFFVDTPEPLMERLRYLRLGTADVAARRELNRRVPEWANPSNTGRPFLTKTEAKPVPAASAAEAQPSLLRRGVRVARRTLKKLTGAVSFFSRAGCGPRSTRAARTRRASRS